MTDVSNYNQVQALVAATLKRFGALHVLFNNAGIAVEGTVTEAPFEGWDKTMATNVGGVFHGCRTAMPHLIESLGRYPPRAACGGSSLRRPEPRRRRG